MFLKEDIKGKGRDTRSLPLFNEALFVTVHFDKSPLKLNGSLSMIHFYWSIPYANVHNSQGGFKQGGFDIQRNVAERLHAVEAFSKISARVQIRFNDFSAKNPIYSFT